MLAFHIVAVSLLAAAVGYASYQAGYRKAQRRMTRRLQANGIELQKDSA